jgi:orotidine-5'-phosphate decarboxylase
VIVALDVETGADAKALVSALGPEADFYKVGLELYTAEGTGLVRWLLGEGKRVFLDLKMYDIGETVKRAVARVSDLGVTFLTVHGSRAAMESAVEGRAGSPLQLLAVTVLTSYDEEDLRDLGYECPPGDLVDLRVRKAAAAGMDGIVCSALEVGRVRAMGGPALTLVTPGVRSAGAAAGDQKRVATPAEALRNGADYLVVGRQLTRAGDPRAAWEALAAEIESVRS